MTIRLDAGSGPDPSGQELSREKMSLVISFPCRSSTYGIVQELTDKPRCMLA